MLADMEFRQNGQVSGIFRVHKPVIRTARNNSRYLSCVLKDRSGQIQAYVWFERRPCIHLENRSLVAVHGCTRCFADRWHIDISEATMEEKRVDNPLMYFSDDYFAVSDGHKRLEAAVRFFNIPALREFVLNVLRQDSIAFPFFSLPASNKQHHAYPGGLFEHSLECVEFVQHASMRQDQARRELAVCAALLHDIGKVRTLDRKGGNLIGALIGHDLLTLELLAQPLAQLDQTWPDGAIALRYLLSWKLQCFGGKTPMMTIAEIVQTADRVSSGMYNEGTLFGAAPAWKKLVTDDNGKKFWRPDPTLAQAA